LLLLLLLLLCPSNSNDCSAGRSQGAGRRTTRLLQRSLCLPLSQFSFEGIQERWWLCRSFVTVAFAAYPHPHPSA
jgi:hypothetical protein